MYKCSRDTTVNMLKAMILILHSCTLVFADPLQTQLDLLQNEIEALKHTRQTYNGRLQELEMDIKQKYQKSVPKMLRNLMINNRESNEGSPVAFSARLSHDLGYLKDDQIFVFDYVITNQGNRYDNRTGIFHCNEAGLYVFQLSVVATPGGYLTSQIAKNHQGQAWSFAHDPTNTSSGGTMVVLNLQPGDAVYARVNGADHDSKHRTVTKQYTSFSGFRIQ